MFLALVIFGSAGATLLHLWWRRACAWKRAVNHEWCPHACSGVGGRGINHLQALREYFTWEIRRWNLKQEMDLENYWWRTGDSK